MSQHTPKSRLELLRDAVQGRTPDKTDCEEMLIRLPAFVDRDLSGLSVEDEALRQHLLLCPDCCHVYVELLELGEAESAGELPDPGEIPPADLSFLPPVDGGEGDA